MCTLGAKQTGTDGCRSVRYNKQGGEIKDLSPELKQSCIKKARNAENLGLHKNTLLNNTSVRVNQWLLTQWI